MNERAAAYLRQHRVMLEINGRSELMLPLDKLQGFLDLLTPFDVPPDKIQALYAYQAEAVQRIRDAVAQHDRAMEDQAS